MKRNLFLGILLALVGVSAVFAGAKKESTGTYADKLIRPGTLTIGTSPDYPPYESLEGDKLVGFDVELMEAVAASMGLKADWNQMSFDSILIALHGGQIDVGVSAFTWTQEREDSGTLFSIPSLKSAQVAFVMENSPIKSGADFPGHHFYAGLGTTGEAALNDLGIDFKLSNSMDNQIAFTLLQQGQIDGVVCDVAVGEGYMRAMDYTPLGRHH
jgi:polar amino acid transport system substrate-binding protein